MQYYIILILVIVIRKSTYIIYLFISIIYVFLFSFRRFVEILKETNFIGVSGEKNFRSGSSKNIAVDIMQFRVEGNESRYKKVGRFTPNASHAMGGE